MRSLVLALVLTAVFAPPAVAGRCDLAVEPAATLLLPYFEADLNDPEGMTTLVSVSNAAPEPALAMVTLWTDWGVPTVNFPIYLTGYDVVTMNMGIMFSDGFVPITATLGTDPNDNVSPQGSLSQDGNFPECELFFPFTEPGEPAIPESILGLMRQAHTGAIDQLSGTCSGEDHGDGRVRGYVTIDTINRCTLTLPSEPEYFADGGTGIASNKNQLFGDFYYVHPAEHYAQGDSLVHIQAFDGVGDGGAWQEGDLTFYGRFNGNSAVDNREPLPSIFGARYLGDFGGGGGTDLVVWRDTQSPDDAAVNCGGYPDWWPLTNGTFFDFDEEETAIEACPSFFLTAPEQKLTPPPAPGEYACLPIASQRIGIAGDQDEGRFSIGVHDAGWLHMDFNGFSEPSQAWVIALLSNSGQFSVGLPAAALHSACDGVPTPLDQ